METRQLRVQALFKRSMAEPWTVSYIAPTSGNMVRASIAALDGGASVGPRLNGVLSSIEQKVDNYPFQYAWDDFLNSTDNLFNARMNGDQLIHLEIGLKLRTILMNVGPDDHVDTGIIDLLPFGTSSSTVTTSEFKTMASVTPDTNPQYDSPDSADWLIIGKLADPKTDLDANGNPVTVTGSVVDGDTIDNFYVLQVGKKIAEVVPQFMVNNQKESNPGGTNSTEYKYDNPIKRGDIINVRFEGINAPEILGHGYGAGIDRDNEYCVTYGVSAQDALTVGDESWYFTAKILGYDPVAKKTTDNFLIALNADSHTYQGDDGKEYELINRDKYNRVTATVYKTRETQSDVFFNGTPVYAENVCKTELVTLSKQVMGNYDGGPKAPPLAIPYYAFMAPGLIGRINTVQWLQDLGLPLPQGVVVPDSGMGLGDLIAAENKKLASFQNSEKNPVTPPTDKFMTEEVKMTDTYNNQIDFIYPDDDRIKDLYPADPKTGNILLTDKVRIGDVALIIPPLSIELNTTSNITKIQTLRTRQSMKIKAGASTNILTLQLYFHDLDSINGIPQQKDWGDHKRNYYMDGLRPLIAQFKKAPFLPIDNEYINNTLNIHEVALVNLAVQTVPGFPHSLTATLTLAEFDIDAYMPQMDRLGNAINYPLLRWFYQQSMRDDIAPDKKDPTRTWLDPIPATGLTSDLTFQMVDEQDLKNRKQALSQMAHLDDPQTAKDKFNNPTNQLNPAENAINPLQMQNAVKKPWQLDDGTKNPLDGANANPDNTLLGRMYADGWAAQHVLNMYNNYQAARLNPVIDWKKFNNVTGTDATGSYSVDSGVLIATSEHTIDIDGLSLFKEIYGDITDEKLLSESHFAPIESWVFRKDRETVTANMGNDDAKAMDTNGIIKIRLYEQANINRFSDKAHKRYMDAAQKDGDFTDILFPANDIHIVQDILNAGKEAEKRYVQNIEDYENSKALVNETEAGFQLYDYDIPGLICTGMQVAYENQFSQAQLLDNKNPTFQFLGGQDPFIQLNFTADEDAIQKLKFMAEEIDRYARDYRTGITSGFLGVKNDLMGLFGMKTVMIENLVYRTMPGFPGHFEVQMNLCGFDKTQKRIESLNGISPIDGTPIKSTRKASNYDPAIDQTIIDYKMKFMEVYPDLELPTYDELNADLPYITSDISLYENRTGGIYVDPDFYIATPVTVRQMIGTNAKTEVALTIRDIHGIEMTTSSQSPNMLDGTSDMWDLLNNIDGSGPKLNPQFSWSGNGVDAIAANAQSTNLTFKSKEVQDFVKDRKNLQTKPSPDQFNAWGLDLYYRDYSSFIENAQPSEVAVYQKIYAMIDKYWGKNLVFNDTYVDPKDKAWQKVTYSSQEDMFDVNYNYIASTSPKYLTNTDAQSKDGKISLSDYKATDSKIPRERLANLIKSLIHVKSQWKQFYGTGSPILDQTGNCAGIMGVPLASEANSKDEAQRLLWDWNHNMEVGFAFLNKEYQNALKNNTIAYQAAPWDWMLYAYSTGTITPTTNISGAAVANTNNAFTTYVYATLDAYYNNYACLYATPSTTVSMDIMSLKNGYNVDQVNLIKGNRDAMISELMAAGYQKDSKNPKDTKTWLEQQTENDIKNIYETWMQKKLSNGAYVYNDQGKGSNTGDVYNVNPYGGLIKMPDIGIDMATDLTNAQKTTKDGSTPDWALNFELYKEYQQYMKAVDNNNLVNEKSPQDIFPKLWIDMIRYDQKFRLLRAFPTFQMFIIDEGRWMTNYKLWDNLYGYNAIQSIDINKSRKIAADTAVIQMTNIYSNITSRAMDNAYGDYKYEFWDNLVWGNPNQEILDARKELLDSMFLQTGARIHLRLGYGSSVPDLPIVFNGTITELDASEIVQIVAQGDGLELTNVISGDPNDTNANFLTCTEPRDLICKLLTSKGNWLKDVINLTTHDEFFRDNPLGIMHFGTPGVVPPGDVGWFNHDYGEAAQNIYSSNGLNTFSEYLYQDGSEIPWNFSGPIWTWGPQAGDEANIIVPFYNNTTWDIAQTIAYCSPDYIAAVMPFELRSTLFFGKPYWEAAYQYDSRYEYNATDKTWTRYKDVEHRKPYMQAHIIDGTMDIVSNGLKASAEDIYTNVIVNYNGKQTPLIMADWDIRFDKQRTTVVDAQLVHKFIQNKGPDFFTTEQQAIYYGCSALRDFMKDMYKGEVLILGDPTIKPHDIVFMKDDVNIMNGNFLVKAVTHHFNQEMGFVTSIQPDAVVVNDDKAMLGLSQWTYTLGIDFTAALVAKKFGARMLRKVIPSSLVSKLLNSGTGAAKNIAVNTLKKQVAKLPDADPDITKFKQLYSKFADAADADKPALMDEMKNISSGLSKRVKGLAKDGQLTDATGKVLAKADAKAIQSAAGIIENTLKGVSAGSKTVEYLGKVGGFIMEDNPLTFIAMSVLQMAGEGIAEWYRRKKALMQAVMMLPIYYQGREYTAGITGHKGMVVGDSMGKYDAFLSGMGWDGKGGKDSLMDYILTDAVKGANWLTGADSIAYSVTDADMQNYMNQQQDNNSGN